MKKVKKNIFWKSSKQWSDFFTKMEKGYFFIAQKSFIISKLDHQMSKTWKNCAADELQTTTKFDRLKNWVPDSAQDRISTNQNMSSRCTSSPIGKIRIFLFLPLPSKLAPKKNGHLTITTTCQILWWLNS